MKKKTAIDINILFIISAALIFTIPGCFRNFWWDEAITLTDFIQLPYIQIYKQYAIANNHIIYTVFLKLWHSITGGLFSSELQYRTLSICAGITALITCYLFLKKIFSEKTALFVTLSFAVSPPFLIYATAVRGYMLSAAVISLIYFPAYNCLHRQKATDFFLFFILSLIAVGIMPTNIIGIYALIISLLPFFIKTEGKIQNIRDLITFFTNRKNLLLILIPPSALILFYAPLLGKLLYILKHNSGAVSHISAFLNLYLAMLISFFPCIIFIFLFKKAVHTEKPDLPPEETKNLAASNRHFINVTYLCLVFLLPLILIFSRTPAPFARIFFQLWPVFIFITGFYIEKALNKEKISSLTRNIIKYYPLLILVWGGIILNTAPVISDTLFNDGLNDDYLSPYYMHNFRPAELVKEADAFCRQNRCRVFVSPVTDYPSINLYSALLNASESFCFLYLPNKKTTVSLPEKKSFLYIANKNENIENFIKKYKIKQLPLWSRRYGIQILYFFGSEKQPEIERALKVK